MTLLSYRNLSIAYSGPRLLDNAALTINKRERICLIGRNGEGKSTLLRILNNEAEPDTGELETTANLRIAKLDQEINLQIKGTVFDVVASVLGPQAQRVADYHSIAIAYAEDRGWKFEIWTENTLQRMNILKKLKPLKPLAPFRKKPKK